MAEDLLLRERLNDVILKIRHDGFSWRMPAHSLLLVNKSSFFQEMLDERAEEEKPTPLAVIGMRPETAVAVLKYIYLNEFPTEVTADLIIAAQKYKLLPLEDNLTERLTEDMTLLQACHIFEELSLRQPRCTSSPVKDLCFKLMESHAFTLFASDMVLSLSRRTLQMLLASDELNIPDEAYLFWGVWRWGRRESSMNERSLKDQDVAAYIDDLLTRIRAPSVRKTDGIPPFVSASFNKCRTCRCRYRCPQDMLDHAVSLRPCSAWEDLMPPKTTEEGDLICIQLSVERDLMLVGVFLEMSLQDSKELQCFIRIFREPENKELRRQEVRCQQVSPIRPGSTEDRGTRVESQVVLHEPLFLVPGCVYSLKLKGNFKACKLAWGPFKKRRMRIGNTFVSFLSEGVTAVRELNVVTDVSVTWGPRGPEA